jgi:hypothetical protein
MTDEQQYAAVQAVQAAVTPEVPSAPTGMQMVYGYVRTPSERQSYVTACRVRFALHCGAKGFLLAQVFVDPCMPATQPNRLGFDDLCHALKSSAAYGVLVMHPRQLSTDAALLTKMATTIHEAGARLLSLRGIPPRPSSGRSASS